MGEGQGWEEVRNAQTICFPHQSSWSVLLCVASASVRLGKQVAELCERYDFVRWVTGGV